VRSAASSPTTASTSRPTTGPKLAGGPLLDLGTYPVALATALLGDAERVLASGQDVPSGVTGQTSIVLATHTATSP